MKTLEAWKGALKEVYESGKDFIDEDERICREVHNMKIEVNNLEDIKEPMEMIKNFKKWIYPDIEDIEQVVLKRELAPDYSYSYGPRIFNFQNSINQIRDFILPLLKKNKTSRRAVITLWDPKVDSNIYKKDIPSLMTIDFKLRDNKLNVTAIIRSNDLLTGFPVNIYQIYVLQRYISERLDVESGKITVFSVSAHFYHDQKKEVKEIIS